MNPKFGIELRRKAIHILALIIPAGLGFFPDKPALILLFSVTAAFALVEVLRLNIAAVQALFLRFFSHLLREHEDRTLTGATAICLSASLCTGLFLILAGSWELPAQASLPLYFAFSYIIVGDAAAALAGKFFGKRRIIGNKTWMGSGACLAACLFIYLVSKGFIGRPFPWEVAVIGALLTTALEILPLRLDDNLRVAPVTCFTMYVLIKAGFFA